jgi:hypothetical protein
MIDHFAAGPIPVAEADTIARAFATGGAVHVRGAIEARLIAEVRAAAEAVFRNWAELAAAGRLPDDVAEQLTRCFIPLARLPLGADRVDGLLHPSFRNVARAYLGKEPDVAPNSHIRSIVPARTDAHLPFHQDQTILKQRLLNVWIPLDPCGHAAPGLEVVWGSWDALMMPAPAPDAAFPVEFARLDPAIVRARFGEAARWTPEFVLGDAMLFSGATIHRTHVTPGMTAGRMSAEIRLV